MEPNHPTPSALINHHAELGGKIYENRKQAKKLADDMKYVEAVNVLRLILGQQIELPVEEPEPTTPPLSEPGADECARIVALLGPAPVAIGDLARLSGSSPAIVRTVLLELEIAGRIERHGGALVSLI